MTLPTLCPFLTRCIMAALAAGEDAAACAILRYAAQDLAAQGLVHGVATLFYALDAAQLTPTVGLALLEATEPLRGRLPMRQAWVRAWQAGWELEVHKRAEPRSIAMHQDGFEDWWKRNGDPEADDDTKTTYYGAYLRGRADVEAEIHMLEDMIK